MRHFAGCLLIAVVACRFVAAAPLAHGESPWRPAIPTALQPAASGDALMADVLARLESHASVVAKLLVRGSLGGRVLQCDDPRVPGSYLHNWDRNREKLSVRLELQGQVDGTPIKLLQVSDGDRLWTDRNLPRGRKVTDVDLRAIRRHVDFANDEAAELPAGAARVLPLRAELSVEQGGLPALVASLTDQFAFSAPQALKLSGVDVLGTVGHWKPHRLAALCPLLPDAKVETSAASDANFPNIPAHLPASVLVVVGRDDLFPYIVEFRRVGTSLAGDASDFQLREDPLLLVRLFERELNVTIDPRAFEFQLGEADSLDLTAQRVERLTRRREARISALLDKPAVAPTPESLRR